ncbi:MAG: hypothetical protein II789_04210, partial [Clostridia bacterium]|nr:hypothetical protein [Clostridia bacterium]
VAILDKFRQILAVLYQRRPKKMSENAERPAKSGRGSGQKERPTFPSASSRPRIRIEGAADLPEREFPAAEQRRRLSRKAPRHLSVLKSDIYPSSKSTFPRALKPSDSVH